MSTSDTLPPSVHLGSLLDRMPCLVYRCGLEDGESARIEYASDGSRALLGIPALAMIGLGWNSIERMTIPHDLNRVRSQKRLSILSHEPYQLLYRLILPDGSVKRIWDQGSPVYDDQGRACAMEGIMIDVTENRIQTLILRDDATRDWKDIDRASGLGKLVGRSKAMQEVYNRILKAAETDTNVIIYGETGSGKDLVAREIHNFSGRKGAYVPVNCGAIPENLIESEFFGYTRGAFTGATQAKEGFLAAADKGTLFLDEIGEMPVHLQVKFLRVLESKTYTPLGSNTPRSSSFRLVGATNRDMAALVREQRTRADFFYRVNVLVIIIPPLRERMEDLPLLVKAWCDRKGVALSMPRRVTVAMLRHNWPGNVRELFNFLDRYAAFGESVVESLGNGSASVGPAGDATALAASEGLTLDQATERLEYEMISRALKRYGGHRGRTAEALGLNLRTLQRKMKQLKVACD